MTKIFDTSSLLMLTDSLFNSTDKIVITSITLKELERIKTAANKDSNIKYSARQLLHLLDQNPDKYECYIYKPYMSHWIEDCDLELNDDAKILAAAYEYYQQHLQEEVIFYTNDLSLKKIASILFKTNVASITSDPDDYTGYFDIYLSENEMAEFYSNPTPFGQQLSMQINQYLNIYTPEGERVDTLCWTKEGFRPLKYRTFTSIQLGDIKPYKGDIYQAMVSDSFLNNQITLVKGPAGAGKSLLAMGFLFSALERGKIDKIIIFCNPVATRNAARLGFYPGSKDDKLLDSQIGNFLASKLGSQVMTEQLIHSEKLLLLPMSDIRGFDASGLKAGIYITEAQNLDITLLKLALQRAGEDSIVILDGDVHSQVDLADYEGANNGMRKVSKIFRGSDVYGEVELKHIHRSKIAEIANQL